IVQYSNVRALCPCGTDPQVPHLLGVIARSDRVRSTATGSADKFQGHQANIPVDSHDAYAIVAFRPDRAGDVRAMIIGRNRSLIVTKIIPLKDPGISRNDTSPGIRP